MMLEFWEGLALGMLGPCAIFSWQYHRDMRLLEDLKIQIWRIAGLARAVLLFHRGGPWTAADAATWRGLTGSDEATTRTLCDVARQVLGQGSP